MILKIILHPSPFSSHRRLHTLKINLSCQWKNHKNLCINFHFSNVPFVIEQICCIPFRFKKNKSNHINRFHRYLLALALASTLFCMLNSFFMFDKTFDVRNRIYWTLNKSCVCRFCYFFILILFPSFYSNTQYNIMVPRDFQQSVI